MTEYDYSEEAYSAFLKHQEGVGRWCANVSRYQSDFKDPFSPTQSESGRRTETNVHTKSMKTDAGAKVSRRPSNSRRSSLTNSTIHLPGPAPVVDYRRVRSMSVVQSPPLAQYPPVYPTPTTHHHHHHHHHRRSRSSSRGPETTSRAMFYAAAGPGPTPFAPQPQYGYPLVHTRGPPPMTLITQPHVRHEPRQLRRGQSHDYTENSRKSSPTKANRKSSHDSPQKNDSPNSLFKRVFGTLKGNISPEPARPRTSHDNKRSNTAPPPERRKRRTSFFW